MSNLDASPISQLLHTLGISREDLEKRSDQMRQFLTAQDPDFDPLRVTNTETSNSGIDIRLPSVASTSAASFSRSRSGTNSYSLRDSPPPITPVKSETTETGSLRHFDSMEMVIERQRRQNRRERKERRERERELAAKTSVPRLSSPSPSNASQTGPILFPCTKSRDEQCVLPGGVGDAAQVSTAQVIVRV